MRRVCAPHRILLTIFAAAAMWVAVPGTAAAAPILRGTSTAADSGKVGSITITKPAGVIVGDVLVAAIDVRQASTSITPPTGWALVRADTNGGMGASLVQAVFVRVTTSLEGSSYTWEFPGRRYAAGAIAAYGGIDTAVPIDGQSGRFTSGSQTITAPSVTTTVAGNVVLGFFGSSVGGSTTPPSGMTERYDAASGSWVKSEGADMVRLVAGASGDKSAVSSVVASSSIGQQVALRTAAVPAPSPPSGDTSPPTTPTGLAVTGSTQTSISLSWNASADNVGVTGYGRYSNSALVSSGAGMTYSFSGLACGTAYTLAIDAYDAAGNRSAKAQLTASTTACSSPLGAALPTLLAQSTGQVFYVATSGSDSNPGTAAAPWRTVQKALDTLQPGQKAFVRAGTYTADHLWSRSGTASAPVSVVAYPGEKPVLHPASTTGDTYPIRITGSYFRLSGFVIENAKGTSCTDVYFDGSAHHIELSNNEIRYSQDQGVFAEDTTSNLHILGNWIHDNGFGHVSGQHQSHGLYIEGSNDLISNNVITDHPYGFGMQIYPKNTGTVIVDNTVVKAGYSGIVVGGSGGVSNITIRNNIFASNSQYGISHDSTCPTSGVKADHNVAYGNGGGAVQSGCSAIDTSGGNTLADPLFVNLLTHDLHLQTGSPAIDKALADWSMGSDRDGRSRPQGSAADVGAFER